MIKKLLLLSLLVSSFSIFAAASGDIAEAKPMKKGDADKEKHEDLKRLEESIHKCNRYANEVRAEKE